MDFYQRHQQERRNASIEWARNVLANPDKYVIFDTETTGLKETDVIIHFAAMDLMRNMLVDTMVKPMSKRRIAEAAQYIHGMTMKDLKDAPIFEKVLAQFLPLVEGKTILSFYADFHERMFQQSYENEGVATNLPYLHFQDVQQPFKDFLSRDRLSLPGRDNTGEGDCNATLDVIIQIADGELRELPPEEANPTAPAQPAFMKVPPKKSSGKGVLFAFLFVLGMAFMQDYWIVGVSLIGTGIYILFKKD